MSEINFLNIIQVLVAIALIGFILIQRGPGATAGSAFGGGASGTVFGAKGSGSFLTKATAILATAFFIITMLIAIDASETYASAGDSAEQDLGVFGSLDDENAEPGMSSTDEEGASVLDVDADSSLDNDGDVINSSNQDSDINDRIEANIEQGAAALEDATDEAVNAVKEASGNAADAVEDAADDAEDQIEQATGSDDDSDGDEG